MLTRRSCVIGLGALAAAPMLQSCNKATTAGALGIAVFSQAVDYGPLYVAENFDWLKTKVLDATIVEHNDPPSFQTALSNGNADILFAAEPPIILGRGSGLDLKIVGVSCTLRQEIVVRSEAGISSISDLQGKRVAVLQGTSSHYGLLNTLRRARVEPGELKFIIPPQAEAAFMAGQIDAWAVWPPFVEKLQMAGKGSVLAGGDAIIQSVYAVTAAALDQKRQAVLALRDAINRAKAWMGQHPQEAQLIVAKRLGLDRKIIEMAWPKHDWSAQVNPTLKDDIANKVQFLVQENLLKSPWSAEDTSNLFYAG